VLLARLRAAGWSGAEGSKRGRRRLLSRLHATVGARATKEAEGDGRGRPAELTGQVGSPPLDSISAKQFFFCLCNILPQRCSTKCPQETKIRIFEIFKFGWSLYWIGILEQFLLGQEVVFCFRAILSLGLSYVSDSNFGLILNVVREIILECSK
jgi:hypothetical protein